MIILASASPRRKELLEKAHIDFVVEKSNVEEVVDNSLNVKDIVLSLAYQKAVDVFSKHSNDIVIAADTLVSIDNKILGKPVDEEDAYNMLSLLSGKAHQVLTGVVIKSKEKEFKETVVSNVWFKEISKDDIIEYVNTKEPMDKAGSYAIQGKASRFIDHIEGDYNNIVGLPVDLVVSELLSFLG